MDQEKADALLQDVAHALLGDPAFKDRTWDSLASVTRIRDQLISTFAYRFEGEEAREVTLDEDTDLEMLLLDLRQTMGDKPDGPWKSCLIRIARPDMEIDIDFEYDDMDRWKVTPENKAKKLAMLRPD